MISIFSKSTIGLDLGSSAIKIIQLEQLKGRFKLIALGMADFPKDILEINPELRKSLIVETIKKVLKESGIKAQNVVTSLSGDAVIPRYIKTLSIPQMDLRSAILKEVDQHIPLSMDQVVLDVHQLSDTVDAEKKIDVLLVAAKNDAIQQRLEILKQAGLTPVIIDVDAFALQNAYEINQATGNKDETLVLLNIGAALTNINIIEAGTTRFTRDITIAGNDFTREIVKEFNLKFSEAEELKKASGSILMEDEEFSLSSVKNQDDRVLRISDAMIPVLNKLLAEVRRSFDYYETQSRKKSIDRIFLSGGTASLKNLSRYLANKIGIPVETAGLFKNIEISSKIDSEQLDGKELQLGVALGLALRRLE